MRYKLISGWFQISFLNLNCRWLRADCRPESVLDEDWDVIVVDAPSGTGSAPLLAALYRLARWFGLAGLVRGLASPGMLTLIWF